MDLSRPCQENDAAELHRWLRAGFGSPPAHHDADVRCNVSRAVVTTSGPSQLKVTGCTGTAADGHWRLDVLYQEGFVAETLVEFVAGTATAERRQIAEALTTYFPDPDDGASSVVAQELASTAGEQDAASWLHLVCLSPGHEACRQFADQMAALAASNAALVRLPGGRPAVKVACRAWPTHIPRDAIDIAVDTRPAKEWQ